MHWAKNCGSTYNGNGGNWERRGFKFVFDMFNFGRGPSGKVVHRGATYLGAGIIAGSGNFLAILFTACRLYGKRRNFSEHI